MHERDALAVVVAKNDLSKPACVVRVRRFSCQRLRIIIREKVEWGWRDHVVVIFVKWNCDFLVCDYEGCLRTPEALHALNRCGLKLVDEYPKVSQDFNAIENAWKILREWSLSPETRSSGVCGPLCGGRTRTGRSSFGIYRPTRKRGRQIA